MKAQRVWAAIAASVVVLIALISTQQTGALWRSQSTISGQKITSGILDLTVGSNGVQQNSFAFSALAKTNLKPGDFAQAPLVLRNAGNVEMNYRLQGVTQSSTTVPLSLTATLVSAEAQCPTTGNPTGTSLYNGTMVGAQAPSGGAWRVMAVGASEVWCLRATLDAAATAQNASSTATFTFRAESR
ncbi:MAG: hypothetical protein ACRCSF_03890 [Mycobacteriaceae bacterium]